MSITLVAWSVIAHPLEHWQPQNGPSYLQNLNGIAHGNEIFVAVGSSLTPTGVTGIGVVLYSTNGIVVTSTNGLDWEPRRVNVKQHLNAVVFANGRFVAVGNGGTILWSEDGDSWSNVSLPTAHNINAIGYGTPTNAPGGLFVAFATLQQTMGLTSSDGISWQTNSLGSLSSIFTGPSGVPVSSITFGHGRFFALWTWNSSGTSQALISDNGFNWSQPPFGTAPTGVADFGYDKFIAVSWFVTGPPPTVLSITSSNGFNWPRGSPPIGIPLRAPRGLCFDGGRFVAVGDAGYTATSQDGTNWAVEILTNSVTLKSVTYGEGIYAAVGTGKQVFTSTDGAFWTQRSMAPNQHLLAVKSGDDKCIAAGWGGTIASSVGPFWESATSPTTNNLRALLNRRGHYIFAGDSGTIVTGDNLTNLSVRTSGTDRTLNGIETDAITYVIVGDAGTVLTSENTTDWTMQNIAVANRLAGVTYGNGVFVAVGDAGTIVTSGDGKQWTRRTSGTSRSFQGIAFGNGVFVAMCLYTAAGTGPFVVISSNGSDWVPVNNSQPGESAIAFGNGLFVYPTYDDGAETRFNVSSDGRNWELWKFSQPVAHEGIVNDLTYCRGAFISVANFGAVWQSDPVFRVIWDANSRLGNLVGPVIGVYGVQVANEFGSPGVWMDLTNLTSFPYIFSDPEANNHAFRYYRAHVVE